jgi:hypothetical protein
MTSPASVLYPKPRDWQHFERLSRALMSEVYGDQFQPWGRAGQRQNGVDIYLLREDGTAVAIQCKGRSKGIGRALSKASIEQELSKLAGFPIPLNEFIVLTTADEDTAWGAWSAEFTALRAASGQCRVSIWGWDMISQLIASHEPVQRTFYGWLFRLQRLSLRQWIGRTVVVAVVIVAGFLFSNEALNARRNQAVRAAASIHDLQEFVALTDSLQRQYESCQNALAAEVFTFSSSLKMKCTEPVAHQVDMIGRQIEKVGAQLDSVAWGEVNTIAKLMLEDYRQGIIALQMTGFYEDRFVRDMKDLCQDAARRPKRSEIDSAYRAGRDAMIQQLNYYFVVRDFIIPALGSMKARTLVHARSLAGQSIPEDLGAQANRLPALLKMRQAYKTLEPKYPFTISKGKTFFDRSVSFTAQEKEGPTDWIEQARWQEVYLLSGLKAFYGRGKDVDYLIDCGVLQPKARELVNML